MGLTLFFSKGLDTDIMLKPDVCTISSMKHGQAYICWFCAFTRKRHSGALICIGSVKKRTLLILPCILEQGKLCVKLVAGTNTRGRSYMIGNHMLLSLAKLYKMLYIVLYCTKACNIVSITSCNTQGR